MTFSRGGGRATNNQHQWQQERATSGVRVSGCGNITINQKISFDSGISKSGGNAAAARMTARAAKAGAMWRQQQGSIAALAAARTEVLCQQQQQRQQQRQEQGQRGDGSCKDDSKGDMAREGKAVTTTGYCGKGGGKVGSDGGGKSDWQRGDNSGVPRQWRWR
jgi:hypothetical protein